MKILIINGPNLNLLGRREPQHYGLQTMEDCLEACRKDFARHEISYFQSNVEGELIDRMQQAEHDHHGIILNAGGYTHTSVAIHDCIKAISIPVIEVHISRVESRESFRRVSMTAPACIGVISGFGLDVYKLGIMALEMHEHDRSK